MYTLNFMIQNQRISLPRVYDVAPFLPLIGDLIIVEDVEYIVIGRKIKYGELKRMVEFGNPVWHHEVHLELEEFKVE